MGNVQQFGYKITKIQELCFLNLLSIKQNLNINEYVYFITKINSKPVNENVGKLINDTKKIKEITLYNILTQKVFIIKDNIESEILFNGIEITYEEVPSLDKIVRICNIFENSCALSLGLSPSEIYIILSTKSNYIQSMDRLAIEINANNANFYVYNVSKDKVLFYEFEKLRAKNVLKLGFECEEKTLSLMESEFNNIRSVSGKDKEVRVLNAVKRNSDNESAEVECKDSKEKSEIGSVPTTTSSSTSALNENVELLNEKKTSRCNSNSNLKVDSNKVSTIIIERKTNSNANITHHFHKTETQKHSDSAQNKNSQIEKIENENNSHSQENLVDVKTTENSSECEGIVLKKKFNTFDNISK